MQSKITIQQAALMVFTIAALALSSCDKPISRTWQTYTAPDGTFSVELPGKPSVETISVPLEGRTVPMTLVSVNPTSSTVYACSYVEDEAVAKKSSDQALESARDGSLRKTEGTVINQKRLTVQGYPALEMQANARGNSLLDSRFIIVGKRLYTIMAVTTVKQDREAQTIQRVFESFNIIKR